MAKEIITVSIDEDTLKEIEEYCKMTGSTRSAAINKILRGVFNGEGLDVTMSMVKSVLRSARSERRKQKKAAANKASSAAKVVKA